MATSFASLKKSRSSSLNKLLINYSSVWSETAKINAFRGVQTKTIVCGHHLLIKLS